MIKDRAKAGARRIIAVGGGKGGVGKSVLSANLAIAMAQRGQSVVLVDGDLGMANLHTLFGIDRPGPGLQALITREIDSLHDVALATGTDGLSLIPGSYAVAGAANIGHTQKQKLLRHIRAIDADVVVIDVGAGVSFNTLDLFDASDLRVIVMTPQVTSIQNAYGFLKGSVHRVLGQTGDTRQQRELIEEASSNGTAARRTRDLIDRVRRDEPALARQLELQLAHFAARVIGNYVYDDRELRTIHSIGKMVRDFLGVQATVIGTVPASRALHASVNERSPLLASDQTADAGVAIREIARALLAENIERIRHGRAGQLTEPTQVAEPPSRLAIAR